MTLSVDHVILTYLSVVSVSESAFLRGWILFIFILTDWTQRERERRAG